MGKYRVSQEIELENILLLENKIFLVHPDAKISNTILYLGIEDNKNFLDITNYVNKEEDIIYADENNTESPTLCNY